MVSVQFKWLRGSPGNGVVIDLGNCWCRIYWASRTARESRSAYFALRPRRNQSPSGALGVFTTLPHHCVAECFSFSFSLLSFLLSPLTHSVFLSLVAFCWVELPSPGLSSASSLSLLNCAGHHFFFPFAAVKSRRTLGPFRFNPGAESLYIRSFSAWSMSTEEEEKAPVLSQHYLLGYNIIVT